MERTEKRICYGKAPGNNLYRAFMGIVGNRGKEVDLAALLAPLGLIDSLEEGAFA